MGSTHILDILTPHLPPAVLSGELSSLASPQSRSAVETLLAFALGGDCPTHLADMRQEWSRRQCRALTALHGVLGEQACAKRARDPDSQDTDDALSKRQKIAEEDEDDLPLFTIPSISTTSPVRKKVDVTVHARSVRFVNPSTRALDSSIPLASIKRAFLLPTRGKTRGHWTVILLPSDIPDKAKASPSSAQQVIFGLDALSTATFETTSYASGSSTPTSTTTVSKGEETAASVRRLLSHVPVPLLEPSATVFRSACATPKSGERAAGIDAYLGAKSGTLWFFDTGVLWGESKPCEFWAVSDLAAKDGVRLISATGRTCSVILSRTCAADDASDAGGDEVVETVFSMVDGREQDPINAWARNRKHLFGKTPVVSSDAASRNQTDTASSGKEARSSQQRHSNGTVRGPAWDDSDSDDEDFEVASSEDLGHSGSDSDSSEGGSGSGGENGSQSEVAEESEEEPEEDEEEELQGAHHPLRLPDAMVVDDASEEEDELEE